MIDSVIKRMFVDNRRIEIGMVYITDKQCIAGLAPDSHGYRHVNLIDCIDKLIYPDEDPKSRELAVRKNNTYVSLYNDPLCNYYFALVDLPNNGELSLSQYIFICSLLDAVGRYDSEDRKIEVRIGTKNPKYTEEDDKKGIEHMKEKLKELVTRHTTVNNKEEILPAGSALMERIYSGENSEYFVNWSEGFTPKGEKLSDEDATKVMEYHVGLSRCKTFGDLIESMSICKMYSGDSYYGALFSKTFSNYSEVSRLFEKMLELPGIKEVPLQELSFENLYGVLKSLADTYKIDGFVPSTR